jgi:hypothetical protein
VLTVVTRTRRNGNVISTLACRISHGLSDTLIEAFRAFLVSVNSIIPPEPSPPVAKYFHEHHFSRPCLFIGAVQQLSSLNNGGVSQPVSACYDEVAAADTSLEIGTPYGSPEYVPAVVVCVFNLLKPSGNCTYRQV